MESLSGDLPCRKLRFEGVHPSGNPLSQTVMNIPVTLLPILLWCLPLTWHPLRSPRQNSPPILLLTGDSQVIQMRSQWKRQNAFVLHNLQAKLRAHRLPSKKHSGQSCAPGRLLKNSGSCAVDSALYTLYPKRSTQVSPAVTPLGHLSFGKWLHLLESPFPR